MNTRPSLSGSLVTSIIALVLLSVTVLASLPSVLAAAFGGGAGEKDPSDTIAALIDEHEALMATYQERFNGRSVFFRPPAPAPPKREVRVREEPKHEVPKPEPPPPGPPPPPATYQGPAVSIVLGDKVLFKGPGGRSGGNWISVGEEVNGLKVLETNAPRSVRVSYQRGEYEVPVFNWDMPFFRDAEKAREPIESLIVTPMPTAPAPTPRATEPPSRNRAVARSAERREGPVDDEDARRLAEERGGEDAVFDDGNHFTGGEPELPDFGPDYDPNAPPDLSEDQLAEDQLEAEEKLQEATQQGGEQR